MVATSLIDRTITTLSLIHNSFASDRKKVTLTLNKQNNKRISHLVKCYLFVVAIHTTLKNEEMTLKSSRHVLLVNNAYEDVLLGMQWHHQRLKKYSSNFFDYHSGLSTFPFAMILLEEFITIDQGSHYSIYGKGVNGKCQNNTGCEVAVTSSQEKIRWLAKLWSIGQVKCGQVTVYVSNLNKVSNIIFRMSSHEYLNA